eukprot:3669206-Heterocapsa_arctica.AAC.1
MCSPTWRNSVEATAEQNLGAYALARLVQKFTANGTEAPTCTAKSKWGYVTIHSELSCRFAPSGAIPAGFEHRGSATRVSEEALHEGYEPNARCGRILDDHSNLALKSDLQNANEPWYLCVALFHPLLILSREVRQAE